MNNRPQDYIDHYSEKNYILHDPVVTEFRRNIHPYSWGDIRIKQRLKKAEKAIIDEAREWGARDGFMVPIVARSGSVSVFCPCGFEPNLSPRARAALEVIAIYSHHALRRALLALQREKVAHTPLTPREREIMQWVAAGKTDDEIGEILTTRNVYGGEPHRERQTQAGHFPSSPRDPASDPVRRDFIMSIELPLSILDFRDNLHRNEAACHVR
ncbi:MAG TPA: autoinducer binding domain-containing protein [Xanthobacteraceae bacterium]|nr:autoinducer binding domain-containing protein [Xanthobacteraceae bacterium]